MMKTYRPHLQLPKTTFQIWLNVISYTIFIGAIIYSVFQLATLPAEVPIHFNFAGEADGWGSKYILLVLPLIAIVMTVALEALEKHPQLHNYPERLNESNVNAFYRTSIRTLNVLKNGILLLFAFLQIEIILAAKESDFTFGLFLPIFIGIVTIVPIVWHLISISKIKQYKKCE